MTPKSDNRASNYVDDGRRVWRASSFGFCDAYHVRVGLGQTPEPPSDTMLERFAEGTDAEAKILAKLHEHGWRTLYPSELGVQYGKVDDTGQLRCELEVGRSVIRCHPDAIAQKFMGKLDEEMGERRVVEVKFLAPGSMKMIDGPIYQWQFAIEMAVTGLPGLYVVGEKIRDPETGEVSLGEVTVTEYDWSPYSLGQIKARVKKLERMIDSGREIPACDWAMYPCGFYPEHDKTTGVWAAKDVETIDDDEIRMAAKSFNAAKELADSYAADAKTAKDELLALVAARDLGDDAGTKYAIADTSVQIVRREGRRRLKKGAKVPDELYEHGDDYWEVRTDG